MINSVVNLLILLIYIGLIQLLGVCSGRRYLRYKRKGVYTKTIYEANSAIAIASFMNGSVALALALLSLLRFKVFFFKLRLALGAYVF